MVGYFNDEQVMNVSRAPIFSVSSMKKLLMLFLASQEKKKNQPLWNNPYHLPLTPRYVNWKQFLPGKKPLDPLSQLFSLIS